MFTKPMKAKKETREDIPWGDYLYEVKFDGIRAIIVWDRSSGVRVYSYNGNDITAQFPELQNMRLNRAIFCSSYAVLDAELVCFKDGVASFSAITSRFHSKEPDKIRQGVIDNPVTAVLFDLIELGDRSTINMKLQQRKELLAGVMVEDGPWGISRIFTNGEALYAREKERNAEGIMAKRKGTLYLPGRRTQAWLKVKIMYEEDVYCYGYTLGKGKRQGVFGALLFSDEHGIHLGNVGTGFTDKELVEMWDFLQLRKPLCVKAGTFHLSRAFPIRVKGMRKNESGAIREPVFVKTLL